MRHLGASVWRAQGVTVAWVEVTTDEPRCGIDPCSPALQRNADPHPAMDRPLSKSRPLPSQKCPQLSAAAEHPSQLSCG
jgi:hypothetical protein